MAQGQAGRGTAAWRSLTTSDHRIARPNSSDRTHPAVASAASTAHFRGMRALVALVAMLASLGSPGCAARRGAPTRRSGAADAAGVEAALRQFLAAFENLDWEPFRASFADDACVFFPSASTPHRFCGRDVFEARFRRFFDSMRSEATSGPPYLDLRPEGVRIEALGDDASLVSFELTNGVRIARRTFVFRKIGGRWRIVHLHASNVPWPDEPRR